MIAGRSPEQPLLDAVGCEARPNEGIRSALDRAMDRVAEGEFAAFDDVFAGLAPRIRAFFTRMSGSSELSTELTESVFARLFAARGAFGRGHGVVAWTYALAREACWRDARVRGRNGGTLAASSPGASTSRTATDAASLVARTLASLPLQEREAFVLSRFEGLSVLEIVHVVGASETAIRQRAARAHEVLRAALAEHAAVRASA